MKTIRLSRITPIAKGFRVYLGNGYTFEFKSLRSAKKFLSDTNDFLTETLSELNYWYTVTHTRYRNNWLVFSHNKKTMGFGNYQDARTCETRLRDVADMLDHAFNHARGENGSTWVFQNFLKSIDCLEQVSLILSNYHRKRSETVQLYDLRNAVKRFIDLRSSLISYGYKQASGKHLRIIEMERQVEMISKFESHKMSS